MEKRMSNGLDVSKNQIFVKAANWPFRQRDGYKCGVYCINVGYIVLVIISLYSGLATSALG